jgi:transcriptional regulator NrdR family protein
MSDAISLRGSQVKQTVYKDREVWRRRINGTHVFSTYERYTGEHIKVTKRIGIVQYFDPYKIFASVVISIKEGKNSDSGDATRLTKKILELLLLELYQESTSIITTKQISKKILVLLKEHAYDASLRYGSRYLI